MMFFDLIRDRVAADYQGVILECRHCGTTLDETVTECPCCGRAEIARYDL